MTSLFIGACCLVWSYSKQHSNTSDKNQYKIPGLRVNIFFVVSEIQSPLVYLLIFLFIYFFDQNKKQAVLLQEVSPPFRKHRNRSNQRTITQLFYGDFRLMSVFGFKTLTISVNRYFYRYKGFHSLIMSKNIRLK